MNTTAVTEPSPDTSSSSSKESDKTIIGIHGVWYDVTEFLSIHPGGDELLRKCARLDMTEIFATWHAKKGGMKLIQRALENGTVKKTGETYTRFEPPTEDDNSAVATEEKKCENDVGSDDNDKALKAEYAKLIQDFKRAGYMTVPWHWWITAFGRIAILFALMIYAAVELKWPLFAGFVCSIFWQQCGGMMHDAMHSNLTYNMAADGWIGWFIGTVCTGINSDWWKDEHDIHHSLVNGLEMIEDPNDSSGGKTLQAADIQMKEDVWAQSLDIVPLFPSEAPFSWLLQYQHCYFLPLVFFLGRPGILIAAFKSERRPRQWVGLALHIYATYCLFLRFDSGIDIAKFFITSLVGEGVLHMQLIVNHYLSGWEMSDNIANNFVRWTCDATYNVISPLWFDWFHVGLHLHIEHHLFPKVARYHFRTIQPIVRDFCQKHGMPYGEIQFWATPFAMFEIFKIGADEVARRDDKLKTE